MSADLIMSAEGLCPERKHCSFFLAVSAALPGLTRQLADLDARWALVEAQLDVLKAQRTAHRAVGPALEQELSEVLGRLLTQDPRPSASDVVAIVQATVREAFGTKEEPDKPESEGPSQ